MGLTYLVYPGAHHTRFHHAIGSMHLMSEAIKVLRFKNISISEEESTALLLAILLHDIGHGPFSHAMENSIVEGISHEEISLKFMNSLNVEFDGKLSLAIKIFKGEYNRCFFYQLISSQLDMDRADYLKRDSFYTGVAEGNVNSERIITMLNVVNDELVIEEKGIYSVEKFLLARRLMYWQVYLHKTSLVAESLLVRVLKRAKELVDLGISVSSSEPFNFFLKQKINSTNFSYKELEVFSKLDDYDIISSMKSWINHEDIVISNLSKMIIDRDLLKVKLSNEPIPETTFDILKNKAKLKYDLTDENLDYFVFKSTVTNQAYSSKDAGIKILMKSKKVLDVAEASDHLNLKVLSKPVKKYFVCYPKDN